MYQDIKCNVLQCSKFTSNENRKVTDFEAILLGHSDLRKSDSFSDARIELNKTKNNIKKPFF